ncbi:uncharacterized protein LOC130694047 [Daphnia carinata]|uniref:uncharacterized protein LOC130694047 n=1 Tax=Daphnia carinata TaxID=120202 RepID=UPI00257DEEEB|nr:uncharacterized protein LOC130694047 [Daphnia carinata]
MEAKSKQVDVPTPSQLTSIRTSASADKAGKIVKKVSDATHGLKFESKLLTLFCIRALGAGKKFELAKERGDVSGKFDDVIFRYQVTDNTPEVKPWRYRYLQAKHKENENEKINADHLLLDNDKGDFSLPKYFRSFCMIRRRGVDIHDCIICTNIGFNSKDFQAKGIELVSINHQPEDILEFGSKEKTRYKLNFTKELRRKALNEWPDILRLAKQLQEYAQNKKTIDTRAGVFSNYFVALINERVIRIDSTNKTNGKFHEDFLNEVKHNGVPDFSNVSPLSDGAKQLRQILSKGAEYGNWEKWEFKLNNKFGKKETDTDIENRLPLNIEDEDIDAFLEKLVFVVNMPNENEFEGILRTKDVSKYYPSKKSKQQTICLLHRVSAKFSKKANGYWLTSEEAKKILLSDVTSISKKNQTRLEAEMGFNEDAMETMASELKKLLAKNERVMRIITPSPRHTAVKIFSAIQKVPQCNRDGSFLVVSLSNLEDKVRWKNILNLNKDSHHLLIVVCDKETPDPCGYAELVQDNPIFNKILFLCRDGTGGMTDSITYAELSKKFQSAILQKTISFQGTKLTVNQLVGNEPDKIIDYLSIEELLFLEGKEINIPRSDTSAYEKSLYIERRLTFAFDESFETILSGYLNCKVVDELHEKCRITPQGEIKWFVKGNEHQSKIWREIKYLANEKMSSNEIHESELIRLAVDSEPLPIIISGAAGTGKSTILSHFCVKMKQEKPDHWIIRINLVEHQTSFLQSVITESEDDAVDFFVKQLHIVENDSPFSRSLLRHRLQTGDRIAFMFDGFDEISHVCQENVIHLMKMLAEKKTIELYVTTRPHMVDELQFELSQLAHHLQILTLNDQIDYLFKYWQAKFRKQKETKQSNEIEMENKRIRKFAEELAKRVSQTLREDEGALIGVPLQCRILAECYQSEVEKQIKNDIAKECLTLDFQHFDLRSLYDRLLDTKRRIFLEEKAKSSSFNQIGKRAMDFLIVAIESYLTKLAIETLVVNETNVNILWPTPLPYFLSATEKSEKENKITDLGVKYGLVLVSKGEEGSKVQFVHHTYAEYLFARYLHRGMDINNVDNKQLLNEIPVRDFVVEEILIQDNYQGVRLFLNSMLNKKKLDGRTELPNHLKNLAIGLAQYINQPERNQRLPNDQHTNALIVTRQTEKLFLFLIDCLYGTLTRTKVCQLLKSASIY